MRISAVRPRSALSTRNSARLRATKSGLGSWKLFRGICPTVVDCLEPLVSSSPRARNALLSICLHLLAFKGGVGFYLFDKPGLGPQFAELGWQTQGLSFAYSAPVSGGLEFL